MAGVSAFRGGADRRPRVGVDFHTFDGIFQGSRSHVLGLFGEAIALAPEIDFVFFLGTPEVLRSEHPAFTRENVELVSMPHRSGPFRLGVQLPWLRRRHRIDLLHTQYRLPFLTLGPCACTIHDVLFESHPEYFGRFFALQSRLTFRMAARSAQLLFSVSEFSRREISQRYGVPEARIGVLYNGVDRARFFPGDEGADALSAMGLHSRGYLLMVGRLEPRKNHVRLIEAYAGLGEDAPPLVCVGQRDFGYADALAAAERLGVAARVRFLERIGDGLLPALMRHARAFVFPAIAEGFGMPVAEAMASGVPVVTSRSTSLPEVAGDAAILVDPLDVDSIRDGIREVLDDSALAGRLTALGLERVARFDWRASARGLVGAYRTFFARQGLPVNEQCVEVER